jgi:hypothetical protein
MTTNKEDSLIISRMSEDTAQLHSILPQTLVLLEKCGADFIVLGGFDGRGVKRCSTTQGRSDSDLDMWREDFIRMRKLGLDVKY